MSVHISSIHEGKKPYKCKNCDQHIPSKHEGKEPFKCQICDLSRHVSSIHEGKKPFKCKICDKKRMKHKKIGSLNIGRGFYNKEELLIHTLQEENFDIFGVSEVDIENF